MLRALTQYNRDDFYNIRKLEQIRADLLSIKNEEIQSKEDAKKYVDVLRMFREAIAETDKLKGENYPVLLESILSVGEDGLYSNNLRFVFELIQNVDDCDYADPHDCALDMRFDFNSDKIILTYNETGFTPFNVFSITGIAEAAKNISSNKEEIGEKGIGFKSVFGVANRVLIESGWFSFSLYKDNFTIPCFEDNNDMFIHGTRMTLFVPSKAQRIYEQLREQYCQKEAAFRSNPVLFLNKLTHLKLYYDSFRSMEFTVTRVSLNEGTSLTKESNVTISVKFGKDPLLAGKVSDQTIKCVRYSRHFVYSQEACKSRYGEKTKVGSEAGKKMLLQVIFPYPDYCKDIGPGGLYSFLPTKIGFTVPIVCHVPFKLDASREFVDSQDRNLWFRKSCEYMQELLDSAYLNWRFEAKEETIRFIPRKTESIIAANNGKEACLRDIGGFSFEHFANIPLILANDGEYHRISDVLCFYPNRLKTDPSVIANLTGYKKALFQYPSGINPLLFGIQIEDDPLKKLYESALDKPSITVQAFKILTDEGYAYSDRDLLAFSDKKLTSEQIEAIMRQEKLSELVKSLSIRKVRITEKCMFYAQVSCDIGRVESVLYKGFEISETPVSVARYLRSVDSSYVCLDIPERSYLPCSNLLVLSNEDPLASFSSFCYDIDNKSNLAVSLRMKEASEQLSKAVEENKGTDQEFLRLLRDNRRFVKDALGENGYKKYIELINRSGIDRNRFIQEILQNADDCLYPEGVVPEFKLDISGNKMIASYNESGFTRANIRAITAIGESTKTNILNDDFNTIGEKGIGFKTIFAIASLVTITSGGICFQLTSQEPTIPRAIETAHTIPGTKMEIVLKPQIVLPTYTDKNIVELCLCLRKLKKLEINGSTVFIKDSENKREITVNSRARVFRRYRHTFRITDIGALEERESYSHKALPEQDIYCYVPDRNMELYYCIYSGLPTKHKLNIPMSIDAPFLLTTSREQIDMDARRWNGIITREMYKAILKVMHASKAIDRIGVLRFIRYYVHQQFNSEIRVNNTTDSDYLNSISIGDLLRDEKILPTYDRNTYASVNSLVFRFPIAVTKLLDAGEGKDNTAFEPAIVLDERTDVITSKEQKEKLEAVIKAIQVKDAPFKTYASFLAKHVDNYIGNEEFRKSLYELLAESPQEYKSMLQEWAIVPVFDKYGDTHYISWKEDKIFIHPNIRKQVADYEILNTSVLPKSQLEIILGVNINVMNRELEQQRYNRKLRELILENDMEMIYYFLIKEFNSGNLDENNSFGLLFEYRESIPLKNELGEITDTELFLCDQPANYFPVRMIQQKIVHKECAGFAKKLRCGSLNEVYYEDLDYYDSLTADDIECLQDEYFLHFEEIMRGFYRDSLIPEELIAEYGLGFLEFSLDRNAEQDLSFPEEPVGNRFKLQEHVTKIMKSPVRIKSIQEVRSVKKGVAPNGALFDLRNEDIREGALNRYSPEGTSRLCFCQMCKKAKLYSFIEVNNIELDPKYYFPELRIALCLECSKMFEAKRSSPLYRERFIERIINTKVADQPVISIPIGDSLIYFTGKHLAEIQEILKQAKHLQ